MYSILIVLAWLVDVSSPHVVPFQISRTVLGLTPYDRAIEAPSRLSLPVHFKLYMSRTCLGVKPFLKIDVSLERNTRQISPT